MEITLPKKFNVTALWPLLRQTVDGWLNHKAPRMAAALAYYIAISLAPLLVISIKVAGMLFHRNVAGDQSVQDQLHRQLVSLTDARVADTLQETIKQAGQNGAGTFATLVSVVVAVLGASGVFAELQDSLDTIWDVRPRSDRGIMGFVRDRFLSMTMVLGVGFLLLVSMLLSAAITGVSTAVIQQTIASYAGLAKSAAFGVDFVFSTVVVTVLFAAIFQVLPDAEIKWKDVWLGAFATALLFQIGKYGMSLYLGKASPGSSYGVAGSIVAMLVWFYYSSQILFFGAEFTRVFANQYGSRIVPSPNAESLKTQ
jgi:membrane protein